MSKKFVKTVISWILVIVMFFTVTPVLTMQVNAATKMKLSSSKITITEGMSQTLKVINIAKGAKMKWKSSD